MTEDGARTWWDLAAAHLGDGAAWRELWDLNQGRVQADGTVLSTERDVLQPGWTVLVPATAARVDRPLPRPPSPHRRSVAVEVTVQAGDTLSEIAADHGVSDWTQAVAGQRRPGRTRRRPVHRPGLHRTGLADHHPHRATAGDTADTATGAADNAADMVVTVGAGRHVVADRR